MNWYYSKNYSHWHAKMEYGIPLPFADKTAAIHALAEAHKYYGINACVGMDGWGIAGKWEIERKTATA